MKLDWMRLEGSDGHAIGRALLMTLYWEETGKELPGISYTDRGKPYFTDGAYHFSISHTANHAFCALSRENIGIDAEETDRKIDPRLADRYLSETERQRLANHPDRNAGLLRLWVLKEALAKLTGRGVGNWLKNTDFDPNDDRITCIDGCFVAILEGDNYGF